MRQENIAERHRSSLKLSIDLVLTTEDSNIFKVRSSDKQTEYNITVLASECTETSCFLRCVDCNVCSHTYMCPCPDSLVLNNMCKHIHLVSRKQLEDGTRKNDSAVHGLQADSTYVNEELDILAASVENVHSAEPRHIKSQISETCRCIEDAANTSLDVTALSQLRTQLNAALNTLRSLSRQDSYSRIRPVSNAPANKNIDKQQRFYSIKKKRQKDFPVRFAKPSRAEKAAFDKEPEWLPHFVSREHPTHAAKKQCTQNDHKH